LVSPKHSRTQPTEDQDHSISQSQNAQDRRLYACTSCRCEADICQSPSKLYTCWEQGGEQVHTIL